MDRFELAMIIQFMKMIKIPKFKSFCLHCEATLVLSNLGEMTEEIGQQVCHETLGFLKHIETIMIMSIYYGKCKKGCHNSVLVYRNRRKRSSTKIQITIWKSSMKTMYFLMNFITLAKLLINPICYCNMEVNNFTVYFNGSSNSTNLQISRLWESPV